MAQTQEWGGHGPRWAAAPPGGGEPEWHKLLYCSVLQGDYFASVVRLFSIVATDQCDIFLSIFELPLKKKKGLNLNNL